MTRPSALVVLLLGACTGAPEPASAPVPPASLPAPTLARQPFELANEPLDTEVAHELEPLLAAACAQVEAFFGRPFPQPFVVLILPDRAAFDATFPPEWGLTSTECWMVATGVADALRLLSPRAWKSEACEHDPADAGHVQRLLTHELVHVYHGQHNPFPDFTGVTGIDWFVEGLAVHASGQLADGSLASAREALASGQGPAELARAWSGKYRYGVSGSLVQYLDRRHGRERIFELLAATNADELFGLLGHGEQELLGAWRESVLAD